MYTASSRCSYKFLTIFTIFVLSGTKGRTDAIELDKKFHDDFEAGQTDEYTREAAEVGDVLTIKLKNDGKGLFSDWFVNKVYIMKTNPPEVCVFPCYRWVDGEIVLFRGKGNYKQVALTNTHGSDCLLQHLTQGHFFQRTWTSRERVRGIHCHPPSVLSIDTKSHFMFNTSVMKMKVLREMGHIYMINGEGAGGLVYAANV